MAVQKQLYTIEQFVEFALQPENSEREFELINGEIIEKMPGRTWNSEIHDIIVAEVRPFCKQHGIACHTSGEAGAYNILGNVVAPDFAYKRTDTSREYPDPIAPLWVVEIISPNDKPREISAKRRIYLQAEIVYWELYPDDERVDVYAPDEPMHSYGVGDSIDLSDLIPNFTLAVKDIFAL